MSKIRVTQESRVCRIALANPQDHNVLDVEMAQELLKALSDAEADSATSSVLIEAEGPMFCGGASPDINAGIYQIGLNATKPIVTAVRGVALGAGLALIAAAHVAVCAQGSTFGFIDLRESRWNEALFRSLSRCIGARRALEIGLTARIFTTPDALSWGLIHQMAPAFELDDRATSIARALATANVEAVRSALSGKN